MLGARQPFVCDPDLTIWRGDALEVLRGMASESIDAIVTSPPYLDARPEYPSPSPAQFGLIFAELRRICVGPLLLNVGRLWRNHVEQQWWSVLLDAARHHEWHQLDTLVWIKPNANPIHGEVFTNSHEYVFVLGFPGDTLNVDSIRVPHAESTQARFGRSWTNHKGVKNPIASKARKTRVEPNPLGGRPRSYIEICVGGEKGNEHPAPMPSQLAEHLVAVSSWPGAVVLDPFAGSGTTLLAARKLGRQSVGIELNPEYCAMAAKRCQQLSLLAEPAA